MSTEQTTSDRRPLSRIERRIVGVLIEKAKTTPDQYPLSLNALVNGCNQKSNRDPQMNLQESQVEDALVKLRQHNAVGEVQGSGRVPKYRHYMKEWLDVSGPELAVMGELLLRGDQTIGELRGRANRMTNNEIADVAALRPVLDSLSQKGLIVALSPSGRGQTVTHALYQAEELAALRQKYGAGEHNVEQVTRPAQSPTAQAPVSPKPSPPTTDKSWNAGDATEQPVPTARDGAPSQAQDLAQEVRKLRDEVARLKKEVEDIWANLR